MGTAPDGAHPPEGARPRVVRAGRGVAAVDCGLPTLDRPSLFYGFDMHRHLYEHMDSIQRLAFCALAAIVLSTVATAALRALMSS